ncbi:hypothetical protein OSB04_017682 [Centaurea solstitialis]|uniref:Uncharacterized protein n=1 Tax=Centaurea solstitialis TaxID=347529 RepID=A0AA38WAW4_9ASTR|nr:hypothetical protein OSB04_017682 [Centaurea solstitialis]
MTKSRSKNLRDLIPFVDIPENDIKAMRRKRSIEDLNTMKQDIKRDNPTTSDQPPRSPKLPHGELLERSNDYIDICVPLYEASITGNWDAARPILDKRRELVRSAITENFDTTLHVAASAKETKLTENFVDNLVNMMDKEDLQLQTRISTPPSV